MLAVNLQWNPQILMLGFISFAHPWMHFRRTADEYILYAVKSGELHIREGEKQYQLKKGHVLLLEPGLEHEGIRKHPCDYYYIHFRHPDIIPVGTDGSLEALAKRVLLTDREDDGGRCYVPKHLAAGDRNAWGGLLTRLADMLQLYRSRQYNRSLTSLRLAELLILLSRGHLQAELARNRRPESKGIIRAHELLDYIHHHYQRKITGKEIETVFECSFDHMNRIFNKLTGCSITHYVNKVRIEQARELIRATHLAVGEIAFLVGFSDVYYFSKVFKRYTGLSPVAYYKRIREPGPGPD